MLRLINVCKSFKYGKNKIKIPSKNPQKPSLKAQKNTQSGGKFDNQAKF